ncbi:hypothetical protein GCM10010503_37520 [Streptomyces lucensis JCM 4490]|uniref:Uncharacterized protein n=1 Tax=Streptomyces lucensis JCM 4490 TaxID=1306176 RepID=A0A918J992_9ACTN|nr:hypothetical protein GCM10010503_37520 [Streptomyces lucensis JCM 4490]
MPDYPAHRSPQPPPVRATGSPPGAGRWTHTLPARLTVASAAGPRPRAPAAALRLLPRPARL